MLVWITCTYLYYNAVSADIDGNNDGPFKVFRVVPTNNNQLKRMIELFETAKTGEVDFWHAPSVVNNTVDVMVSPSFASKFEKFLKEHGYPFHIAVQDLNKNAFFGFTLLY
ncbi:unnamed protein product [Angiostrongylus costaricensis]|uniref:Zinc carboxypeptidase A 1 n=1 Tax=Angiostrongylus costaricensis TaxID=334426 RepID=A0A0R3PE18_ANGCS|nr:unnamed protein product [Angiostrongylus costaricensis]